MPTLRGRSSGGTGLQAGHRGRARSPLGEKELYMDKKYKPEFPTLCGLERSEEQRGGDDRAHQSGPKARRSARIP